MKVMKKMTALLAVCAIAIGMSACGTSDPIVAENANTKITLGGYAYCMYQAYYSASNLVPNATAPILSQEIDGKPVPDWMKEQALKSMKSLFAVDAKAKELGVTLTDAERKDMDDNMNSVWNTSQDSIKELANYGITKEGAEQFYMEYQTMYTKVFQTMYGENGPKAVSADDKKQYFIDNYTDFGYIQKSVSSLSDDEKAAAKSTFDGYASAINDKSKTIEQVSDEYKTAEKLTTDPLKTSVENLSSSTKYQPEMISALKEMKPGEARVIDLSGSSYMLVVKNDINASADEKLKDKTIDFQILVSLKGDEYISDMDKESENFTDYTVHDNVINQFDPSVFEKPQDTSSDESTPVNDVQSKVANDTQSQTASDITSSDSTTSN